MIETIDDAADFARLEPEWKAVLGSSPSNCLFLTWEWLHTWWKHLAGERRLHVLVVRSDRSLQAVAPLAIRPRYLSRLRPFAALEFLGTGSIGSDYLDLIVRRGQEAPVLKALADHLAHGTLMLELAQVRKDRSLARSLAEAITRQGWSQFALKTAVCPFIDLSGQSWRSYLTSLGPAHRANLLRRLRNLERRYEVRFEEVATEAERGEALALLVRLHNLRWRNLGGSTAFYLPGLLAFHDEFSALALQRGWLRLFVLRLDGRAVAALYGFRYGRTFYFYQSGFDPAFGSYSVGLVTMGLTIRRAIEEGASEFDLLHGAEAYKFLWAREARELERLEIYPPRASGALHKGFNEASRGARSLARQVLSRTAANRTAAAETVRDEEGIG